jgi:ATP-binding cassette subfamily A (ABC1) protein 3
MFGEAD